MTQIAVSSGASASFTLPAGNRALIAGQGTYRIGPRGTSARPTVDELIDNNTSIGPYEADCTVQIWSTGATTYELISPSDVLDQTGRPIEGAALRSLVSGAGLLLERATVGGYPPVGVLSRSAVAFPHTGTTAATKVVSLWLPRGTLGPNGAWRLTLWTSETNNANGKTLIVRLNSTPIYQANLTSLAGRRLQFEGWNRGATGSQLNFATGVATPLGGFGQPWVSTSFDSATTDIEIQIVVQLANAADTFTVEASLLELLAD
jgi:hypothetical protein